jgi:hypothetical protein
MVMRSISDMSDSSIPYLIILYEAPGGAAVRLVLVRQAPLANLPNSRRALFYARARDQIGRLWVTDIEAYFS